MNFFQAQEIVSEHTSLIAAQCKLQEEYTELLAEEFPGILAQKKAVAGTPSPAKSAGSARSSASKPKVREASCEAKAKKCCRNPEPPNDDTDALDAETQSMDPAPVADDNDSDKSDG